jgi:hypothetical protein
MFITNENNFFIFLFLAIKVWKINPATAWSSCSAICINQNLASRQLASSKGTANKNKTLGWKFSFI